MFRGQFIAGPLDRGPAGWAGVDVAPGFKLYHHPLLPVSISGSSVLIGHVFDPEHPDWGSHAILENLRADVLPNRTDRLAGRWVLIDRGEVINDACGTLPIAYLERNGQLFVASSTALLEHCLETVRAPYAQKGPWHDQRMSVPSGFAFSVTCTALLSARILLPNHALDLATREVRRFYPRRHLGERRVKDAGPELAKMLAAIIKAASLRAPLAIGITAGYDSRALAAALAVTPGLPERSRFFTFQDEYSPPGHTDISTGRKIAECVGAPFREIVSRHASRVTQEVCRTSEHMIAPRFESWTEQCADPYLVDRLVLMGWCSEVGRAFIRWAGSENATAEQVAICHEMRQLPEALPEFNAWTIEAEHIRDAYGIPIMDLFYWEYRGTCWCGAGLNILNTVTDWVSVYSCRQLLDLMLSVPEGERAGHRQMLYRELIASLRPELLKIPFNDLPWRQRAGKVIKREARRIAITALMRLGVYNVFRSLKRRLFGA